jgi:hypothetical protein
MTESFADYAIAHEAGHAVVGKFVKISAPHAISFDLRCDPDGKLCLGDFAMSSLFPPDDQIATLPDEVKNCLCYMLAGGIAGAQFSCLPVPNEHDGLGGDRRQLGKLTPKPLESFIPHALAVIKLESAAFQEIVSQCTRKYEQLKKENVKPGVQILLDNQELESIFKRTLSPRSTEHNSKLQDIMSAHEAGHATLGVTLGVRVEAVYALRGDTNPITGNIRIRYLTRFGARAKAALDLKSTILLTAAGAAGEVLLNGNWDQENVRQDRTDLEEIGAWNFDYCVEQAVHLLRENKVLLVAARDRIKASMSNFKQCQVTRKGAYIILAKGSEIEKLFRNVGFSVSPEVLDLDTARLRVADQIS